MCGLGLVSEGSFDQRAEADQFDSLQYNSADVALLQDGSSSGGTAATMRNEWMVRDQERRFGLGRGGAVFEVAGSS